MNQIILAILMGVLAGILRTAMGYFKSSSDEIFEWNKFLKTLGTSVVLGLILGIFIIDWKYVFLTVFVGDIVIEEIIKGLLKQRE